MVLDQTGGLAGVSRHDYLPFGEEIGAGVGGRMTAQGYSQSDGVRQKFTGYERDNETGLDYAQARYYSYSHGRFTSPDPLLASGKPSSPQSWNRYAYVGNNPLAYTDPNGMFAVPLDDEQQQQQQAPDNHRTRTNGNPADEAVDANLAKILTDGKNGMVVGISADDNQLKGDTHFRTADGLFHTVHVFGDRPGNRIVGVYAPAEFSDIKYEGGPNSIVSATNPKTGEVLGFAHVDVSSEKELQQNINFTNLAVDCGGR